MDLTTFSDVFRKSFIENFSGLSFGTSLAALASACLVGLFIHQVYKMTFTGVMYSQPFNTSLVLLSMLTTLVIMAVTSNVVLSLGMVGALSIVRFRTAIKDPLDLVFLFWSLSVGIILGAGMFALAYIGSVVIGVTLIGFSKKRPSTVPYMLMLGLDGDAAEIMVYGILKKRFLKIQLKSKTVTSNGIELMYEIKMKDENSTFIQEIAQVPGVKTTALVSCNGQISA